MKEFLSPKTKTQSPGFSGLEVAKICGVANQTVINWIKKGHLEAFKTSGGHYKIGPMALVSFLNAQGLPIPKVHENLIFRGYSPSILVVENDPLQRELYQIRFNQFIKNHKIHLAQNAFEMGFLLGLHFPRIVVLNLDLPGIKPLEIGLQLKQMNPLQKPVLIGIGKVYDPQKHHDLKKNGFDEILLAWDDELIENIKKYFEEGDRSW